MEQQLNYCPVRRQALLQADAVAIATAQGSLTFKDLDLRICNLQKQLCSAGLKTGDRLVCVAKNSLNLILLQLCCLRNGVIFCPINPQFSKQEISVRLNILNSRFVWFEQAALQLNLASLVFDFAANDNSKATNTQLKINPQKVINIIFTSGSSGQPKAVMHNFSNHFYSASGSQTQIPLAPGDKNLLSLPIFHISGYATVIRSIISGATLLLTAEKVTPQTLKKLRITHLSLVAAQLFNLLKNSDFKQSNLQIKHLLLGGSAFSDQLLEQTAERGFTYHLSYGLTEMSSQVATSSNNQCLHLLKHRELKILNQEILLRGKTRFVGYFNGSMENSIIPEKQWFASKDLGMMVDQHLQIIGRKDRQFISGGENIQPEEIERILLSFSAIKQAYVVAVDDPRFGQRPVAFIDWQVQQPLTEQLTVYLKKRLSTYKIPLHYFLLTAQTTLKVSLKTLQQTAQSYCNEMRSNITDNNLNLSKPLSKESKTK